MKSSQCAWLDIIFNFSKSFFLSYTMPYPWLPLKILIQMIFAWIGIWSHPCLWLSWLILWIGLFLHWFLPNLCQSNETSFWFQRNMPEFRHPNESSSCQSVSLEALHLFQWCRHYFKCFRIRLWELSSQLEQFRIYKEFIQHLPCVLH